MIAENMDNVSLSTLANFAEIVGGLSILTGLVFGKVQLRYFRGEQRNAVAANLTQAFYNHDLAQALALLQSVPDGTSLEEIRSLGPEYMAAAITVSTSFETMGFMMFKRVASLEMVLDLAGGIIFTMSRKLKQVQEDLHQELQQASWAEWFEWLANQARKKRLPMSQPISASATGSGRVASEMESGSISTHPISWTC